MSAPAVPIDSIDRTAADSRTLLRVSAVLATRDPCETLEGNV